MMKKRIYLVAFFTILTSYAMNAQKPTITITPHSNSQFVPNYVTNINGIEFSIAVDPHKKLFISTIDPNFKQEGKPVVGRTLSSFKNKADIKLIKGWGYYLKIDEYWYARFSIKDAGDDDSKVWSVFQYEF